MSYQEPSIGQHIVRFCGFLAVLAYLFSSTIATALPIPYIEEVCLVLGILGLIVSLFDPSNRRLISKTLDFILVEDRIGLARKSVWEDQDVVDQLNWNIGSGANDQHG